MPATPTRCDHQNCLLCALRAKLPLAADSWAGCSGWINHSWLDPFVQGTVSGAISFLNPSSSINTCMLHLVIHSINKSRRFFLRRGEWSQNRKRPFLEPSAAPPPPERARPSLTAAAAPWWSVISEKYGKSLESLLPSREIPAEELNLSQSAEKQRCQTQLRLAVVKQTIYALNFLKDESPRPFLNNRPPEAGTGVGSRVDTIVILPIPGPLSDTLAFMPTDESNSDILQSNSRLYFKCKYSGVHKCVLWPLFPCLPTAMYCSQTSFLCVSERPGLKK